MHTILYYITVSIKICFSDCVFISMHPFALKRISQRIWKQFYWADQENLYIDDMLIILSQNRLILDKKTKSQIYKRWTSH